MTQSLETLYKTLDSSPTGLSTQKATLLLSKHGKNVLKPPAPDSLFQKYLDQFRNPLILLLLSSAGLSILLGQYDDAISIALAILIVTTVALVQEHQAEKSVNALVSLVPHRCRVLRDGVVVEKDAAVLVPGDVVEIATGDRVPADIRLIEVFLR